MTARAWLWCAVVVAEVAALVAAVRYERQHPTRPRFPVSQLLLVAVVIDLAVGIHDPPSSYGLVAVAASGPRPREGLPLLAYHAADALVMAWSVMLAWTCLRAFGEHEAPTVAGRPVRLSNPTTVIKSRPNSDRAADLLAGVYLGAVVGLVALHPIGRVGAGRVLLGVELVALVVAGGAILSGWRRAVAGRATWTRQHGALLVLAPVELAVAVIGPFARPDVFSSWQVARWQYLIAFVLVAALLVWPRRSTARR